jgi:hypothetical protein
MHSPEDPMPRSVLSERWTAVRQSHGKRYQSCWYEWLGPGPYHPGRGAGWQKPGTNSVGSGGRQCPEWKNIFDRSPIYKSCWVQWNSLLVRDGMMEWKWQSTDGLSKTAEIVLPESKMKEVLGELHWGLSGHLRIRLHAWGGAEKWCQQCDTCAASWGP